MTVSALDVSGTTVEPTCNPSNGLQNGSITLNVSGDTNNVTYTWSTQNGSGLSTSEMNQSNLGSGTYTVTATNGQGCEATESFTLATPNIISILASSTEPTCHDGGDGLIALQVNGGSGAPYTYEWITLDGGGIVNGQSEQAGLSPGTYRVTVTDNSGCSQADAYTLNNPDELPDVQEEQTVCSNELPIEWNGQVITESG